METSNFFTRISKALAVLRRPNQEEAPKATALGNGTYRTLFTLSYNGEKNLGEAGPVIEYRVDRQMLTTRSWGLYLTSEAAQTVVGKYATWMIGKGLKLQCEPAKPVLEGYGLDVNVSEFNKIVESAFSLYKSSRYSDNAQMESADLLARTALINSIVGGDVLLVLRFDGSNVTTQLIDGQHVQSPAFGSEWWPQELENGNQIINGIEQDKKGTHIAYHVIQKDLSFKRIPARSKDGVLIVARMIYGFRYRLNNNRGMPLLCACIETLNQLDRYKSAVLGNAEELAKLIYTLEHGVYSTGESIFLNQTLQASGFNGTTGDVNADSLGESIANKVSASTNRQAFNLPKGSSLKTVANKNQLYFKDFFTTNIELVCAAIQIPPGVAMSKYDDSYSASRAGLKDWEHVLNVKRPEFAFQYYQPLYEFWLDVQVLTNKIQAPGYILARQRQDWMVLEAYRNCRFVGPQVPHIDPEKEARAERIKLGEACESIPLTTAEAATERLDGGDFSENLRQVEDELKNTKDAGIVPEPEPAPEIGGKPPVAPKKKEK